MKTNILVGIFVIGLMAFGTYVAHSCPDLSATTGSTTLMENTADNVIILIRDYTIMPDVVTVKSGTQVTWINNDKVDHAIASDPHPDHSDLPELISDVLEPGDSYSFTFVKMGEWGYHSHLHPNVKGRIIVVE